jgi:hypothetical protein
MTAVPNLKRSFRLSCDTRVWMYLQTSHGPNQVNLTTPPRKHRRGLPLRAVWLETRSGTRGYGLGQVNGFLVCSLTRQR